MPFDCRETRLLSFYEVRAGDHIKQPDENRTRHTIIKEIHNMTDNGSSAILTLMELMTHPFDSKPKIREYTVVKNLYHDEIYRMCYHYKTHSPEEIIRRANLLMTKDSSCNCNSIYLIMSD